MPKQSLKTITKKFNKEIIDSDSIDSSSEVTKSTSQQDDINKNITDSDISSNIYIEEDTRAKIKVLTETIYPCKDQILHDRVELKPYQMNNNLTINLKYNLVKKVENKCNEFGFVVKVYKLLNYSSGIIDQENFTGSAVYDVEYLAKLCVIVPNITIVTNIVKQISNSMQVKFGNIVNIIVQINKENVDTNIFDIGNNYVLTHKITDQQIKIGDNVKIKIKAIKFLKNDITILAMGQLVDIATSNDIKQFGFNDNNDGNIKEEQKSNIFFNEDNEIEENNINKTI